MFIADRISNSLFFLCLKTLRRRCDRFTRTQKGSCSGHGSFCQGLYAKDEGPCRQTGGAIRSRNCGFVDAFWTPFWSRYVYPAAEHNILLYWLNPNINSSYLLHSFAEQSRQECCAEKSPDSNCSVILSIQQQGWSPMGPRKEFMSAKKQLI